MRIFLSVLLSALTLNAQDSAAYRACTAKAQAQMELNTCAGDEAARVDRELNEVYRQLLARAKDDTDATEKLKAAERAWIAYRDAYIEAAYPAKDKRLEYGSIYPMDAALLQAKLTRRQIAALKDLLKQ